jgi:hypothetical protein
MALISLSDLKQALRISNGYTDDDALLQLCIAASDEYILQRTRYSLTDLSGRVDYFHSILWGTKVTLSKRPVSGVASEWRYPSKGGAWAEAQVEVEDPEEGVVAVVGPVLTPTDSLFSPSSEYIDVRITYNVRGLSSPPARLKQASLRLASFLFDLTRGAASTAVSIGDLRVSLDTAGTPRDVEIILSGYSIGGTASWV